MFNLNVEPEYRYNGEAEGQRVMQHLTRISVGDRWVTRLSWSRSTALSPGNCRCIPALTEVNSNLIVSHIQLSLTWHVHSRTDQL